MFALVENGFVTAISKTSTDGYIQCGDAVAVDWSYSAGNFYSPAKSQPQHQTPQQILVSLAQTALTKSDTTIIRCVSAGVAVPSEWNNYRIALRAIVNGSDVTSTQLPTVPSYPSGT